jgi:putative ABC transport system permease protein
MRLPGKEIERGDDDGVSIRQVTPKYFDALRIPVKSGRVFSELDRSGTPKVVILNDSASKKFFKGESPIGKTVLFGDEEHTVVGVVGDVYQSSLETDPRIEAYTPMAQSRARFAELVIRTSGDPYDVVPSVKSAVLAVLPDVPLRNIRTMEELIARRVAQRKLNMLLLGLFGVLGLVISAVGIYGVMAYTVSQRTREIGVRMALGATKSTVIGMVMRQASLLLAVGLVVGALGAWRLSAIAERFLFRLDTHDPRAFAAALATLSLAALIASIIPARRAASVDPMEALRAE